MVKFKEFADFLVSQRITTEGALIQLRRQLRGAGLVSSGGQGFASQPIEVSDVTNVIIGLVAAEQVKQAPAVVQLYRSAEFVPDWSKNCTPWPFDNVEPTDTLGTVLDRFFEGMLHNRKNNEWYWTNVTFEFAITDGLTSAGASLSFDDGSFTHTAEFHGFNSDTKREIDNGDLTKILELQTPRIDRSASISDALLRPVVIFVCDNLFPDEEAVSE